MMPIRTILLLIVSLAIASSSIADPTKTLPVHPTLNPLVPTTENEEIIAALKEALSVALGESNNLSDAISFQSRADGGSDITATISLFGQGDVVLSSSYSANKRIEFLDIKFPESSSLDFQKLDQLVDGHLRAYLPDAIPLEAGIWIKNLHIEFGVANYIPQKIRTAISSSSAWPVLGVGSFVTEGIEAFFAISNPKGPERTIIGGLAATAKVGNIEMTIEGDLSNNQSEIALSASIEKINLENILDLVLGNSSTSFLNTTPALFKSLELSKLEFAIVPFEKALNFSAASTMGNVFVDVSRNQGVQKIIFALTPPASFKFSELSSVLAPMDGLDLSGSHFIVANKSGVIPAKFLSAGDVSDKIFPVKRGLNLVTSIALPQNVQEMLKVSDITLSGSIPPTFNGMNLYAELGLKLELGDGAFSFDALGAGLNLKNTEAEIKFEGVGSFQAGRDRVQIFGGLILSATDQTLEFEAGLAAGDRRAAKPASCLQEQQEWTNPFQVPGVGIRSLGIRAGVGVRFPWINTVGLDGNVRMGTVSNSSKHICGALTAFLNIADVSETMLIAEVQNITPISFIEAFSEDTKIEGSLRDALSTGIQRAKLKVVPTEIELFGQTYSPGVTLDSAKVNLAGINGLLGFSVNESGIKAFGAMDPYSIEEANITFFEIKGSRPNLDGSKAGPNISLGLDAVDPHFRLDGSVTLLGITNESFIKIDKNGFEYQTTGNVLNGSLGVTAHVKAGKLTADSGLYARVAFNNRLQTMVADQLLYFIEQETKKNQAAYRDAQNVLSQAKTKNVFEQFWVDAANETVGAFKEMDRGAAVAGSYVVKGLLKDAINIRSMSFEGQLTAMKGTVEVEIDMTIAGETLKEKAMVSLNLTEAEFSNAIVGIIGDEVVDFFGQIDNEVVDAFDDLGNELETAFEDVGNELVKGAEVVGEGVITAAEFIGNGIIDGFNAIDNFFNGSTFAPKVSNGSLAAIPPNHTHFRVTVNSITVTGDEGGFTPALELFGSLSISVTNNIKTNKGATPFAYALSARGRKEVALNRSIPVNHVKDFYIDTDVLRTQGGRITLYSKMSEWNNSEADIENLSGYAYLELGYWNLGTNVDATFTASDGEGESISVSANIVTVGRRDPIPNKQQMLAAASRGNVNELYQLVANGGQVRQSGMIESAISGNASYQTIQYLLSAGNRAKTSQVELATDSRHYNAETAKLLLNYGAYGNSNALLNAVSRNDIQLVNTLVLRKAVPNLNHIQAAIKVNNVEMVRYLMSTGNVQVGTSELQYAIDKNDDALVQSFINHGATATAPQITTAIQKGNNNMVNQLLKVGSADQSALEEAAKRNDTGLYRMLLNNGVSIENTVPVKSAIDNRNYEIVQLSLQSGASQNETLTYAISKNDKNAIVLALESGADGTLALDHAIQTKDVQLYEQLLFKYRGDSNQALTKSFDSNDLPMGQLAITAGADPNLLIGSAAGNGRRDWVEMMISAGADANHGMQSAVDNQRIEMVKFLIGNGGSAEAPALIYSAATNKNLDLVKVLVEQGYADPENARGVAIGNNDLTMVSYLLANGARATGLQTPSQNGWFQMVELLISYGADPNEGLGPSIQGNRTNVAIYLLDNGASPADYIKVTSVNGNATITAKLLEKGADPNVGTLNAAKYRHVEVMRQLIDYKADVSKPAIMNTAVTNLDESMIVLLLANGGDVKFITGKRETYLHRLASIKEQGRLVRIFIKGGVALEAKNDKGETALHLAVRNGKKNIDSVRFLIQGGANVNAKTARGRSVLQRANNKDAKELLEAAGAVKK